jgi:glycerol-3-phosphate dehydrogenase subunit B
MDDVLVIGAGPAGLLAAWVARRRGARVRVLASGVGTTHVAPGWLGVLDAEGDLQVALQRWIADHPRHPYALTGPEALAGGLASLEEICRPAGLRYVGDLRANFRLPTALGAVLPAALVPESFAAGDLRQPGPMLIAGPAGWRDFYPALCAGNLARQGFPARAATFDLARWAGSRFDPTPVSLAQLFEQPQVRQEVARQLKPALAGVARVGFPAVLGLTRASEVWQEMQERLGVPVFEIPTLPPSVPGMRLFNAFKASLSQAGVPILLDMTVARGMSENGRAVGVVVPTPAREAVYRADMVILATGGLYGGGITSYRDGTMREVIFGLPLHAPDGLTNWFGHRFLGRHPVHEAGVLANARLQPVDAAGQVVLENVRIVGRLLAHYDPLLEGSAEGVWLATAYHAASGT